MKCWTSAAIALQLVIGLAVLTPSAAVAKNPASEATATYPDSTPGVGPVRNEDWFVKVWHERRDLFAKEKTEQQHAIVFLGDSITQGWSEDFRGRFKNSNLKLANRGISGDITRGVLARLDDDVLALDPQAVVLLIGTNDLDVGLSPEQIAANVKLILDRLTAHSPKMPIILCKVMPSSATKKRPADKIRDLNDRVAAIASAYKQVTILDTYTLFANSEGDAKPEEFPDLLHPNDVGYDKWHDALIPLFTKLGLLKTDDVKTLQREWLLKTDADEKALQGDWLPTKAELAGKPMPEVVLKTISLKLIKNNYEVLVAGSPDNGTWSIDPDAQPKAMTVKGVKGPNAGKTFPAIYELDGDTLRVCYDLSGNARPKEFKTSEGTKLYLVTYKRKHT